MSTIVSTTCGSLPNVSRVHSSAICRGAQIGIPGEAAEAVEIRLRQVIAEPVVVEPDVGDADEAAGRPMERLAGDERLHRRAAGRSRACRNRAPPSTSAPGRPVWRAWPKYSCVICSSIAWLVFSSAPNSGDAGSRTWKSIGPCLIWMIDVVVELAVERHGSCRRRRGRDRSSDCSSPCDGRRRSRDRRAGRRAA